MLYSVASAWSRFVICFRPNIRIAVCFVVLALSLQGCGRRGPLEPPPGSAPTNAPLTGVPDQYTTPRSAAELPGFVPQASGASADANVVAPGTPNAPAAPASPAPPPVKAPARPFPLDPLL
jgi:predicted small lipoprotein YifL